MYLRKLGTGLVVTTVAATTLGLTSWAPANAEPSFVPNAANSTNPDVVGVGSDTIEHVMQAVADAYNAGKADGRLVSFDATDPANPTAANQVITPRSGAATITRPNGSGAGINALIADTANPEVINFARSSSALNPSNAAQANLRAFPFAVDGLKAAVSGLVASHAPASLTIQDLVNIYKGTYTRWNQIPGNSAGSSDFIKPFLPPASSGTGKYFLAQLQAANGGNAISPAAANGDYQGVQTSQEHKPDAIQGDANAIAPFSTARAQTLANPAAIHLEDGWSAKRAVYNVVRQSDLNATWVTSLFATGGFLCSPQAKSVIEAQGFAQLASPPVGQCGQATPDQTTNLATNTVTTATALAASSPAGRAVKLVATVSGSDTAADGTVDFLENGAVVGSGVLTGGQSTLDLTGVAPGSHTYTAKFTPNNPASFTPSEASGATVTVKDASTTALSTAPTVTTWGHGRTATATVTSPSGVPTGTVTFAVGGTPVGTVALSGGVARLALNPAYNAGAYAVTATYNGDAAIAGSTGGSTLSVRKSASTISESFVSIVPKRQRATGTVRAALTPGSAYRPTGTVVVKKGATVIARGTLRNGAAVLNLPRLRKGSYTLTMSYLGSGNVTAVTKYFTLRQR